MSPAPARNRYRVSLFGSDSAGEPIGVGIACRLLSEPTRSLGIGGDILIVGVKRSLWPGDGPEGWDITKNFRVTFGIVTEPGAADVQVVTLGGYRLVSVDASVWGVARSAAAITDPEATPTEQEVQLTFYTWTFVQRQTKGAVLRHKTLNPLRADGLVDTAHADYKTNTQLAELCLDTLACTCTGLPAFLGDFGPPGKLDWGNAPAMDELDGLIARIGGSLALNNAGDDLAIVKLPKGGETITLDGVITLNAEPYRLAESPSARHSRIIVTSGRTRVTVVRRITLAGLEWVWQGESGLWNNAAQTAAMPGGGGISPDAIESFRLPPKPGETTRALQYKRLFRALRATNAADRKAMERMVNLPQAFEFGDGQKLGGSACAVYAHCAVPHAGFIRNFPADSASPPARINGVRAYPLHGVVELPDDVLGVRAPLTPGVFAVSDAVTLSPADLTLIFAHESDTGTWTDDYFVVGYKATVSGGAVTVSEMTDEERDAAIIDADVPKVSMDWLRLVAQESTGESRTFINLSDMKAAAADLAKAHLSGGMVKSGVIPVRGIRDIAPGSSGGAVTRVVWSLDECVTKVEINAHEVPGSFFEQLEQAAGRSLGAGLLRGLDPRSASAFGAAASSITVGGVG